jgi:predicted alpha/beta superfamily hydrolase
MPLFTDQAFPPDWQSAPLSRSLSFEINSAYTGQRYRILLGLPHQAPDSAGYPVLWALDGQASLPIMEFARPKPVTAKESPQWRARVGEQAALLIVAIAYASGEPIDVHARAQDYTPQIAGAGDAFSPRHGGAAAFLSFLTQELRPLLAQHFAMDARRHTLFGFSYGGLFTLHTLSTAPQHFQRYWAASPSLWFGDHHTLSQLPLRLDQLKSQFSQADWQVMITVGAQEQDPPFDAAAALQQKLAERRMVDSAERFAQTLNEAGIATEYQCLPAHDHYDMLMHGARRVVDFASRAC